MLLRKSGVDALASCKAQRTAALQDAAGASAELQQQLEQLRSEAAQASKSLQKWREHL